MKAQMKITVMLMAMTIGTLAASGQSAQRGTPHSKDQRSQSKQKTSTTNRRNPKSTYREADRTVYVSKTHKDPKARNKSVNHKDIRRTNTVVANNNHKHYANSKGHYYYPQKRVKIHVHPTSNRNNYKAMYYPSHREIIWTRKMNNYYIGIYPGYAWRYPVGHRINTISAFETRYNVGEVNRVYGRVYATWYNRESDDLLLFFGGEYPNQTFTMVVPGNVARRYSWKPERYFLGQHVMATGLITSYEGNSEMILKRKHQLEVY
jgi:hypothetical protein